MSTETIRQLRVALQRAEAVIEAAHAFKANSEQPGFYIHGMTAGTFHALMEALAAYDRALSTTQPHPFVASNEDFDTRCVVCGCKAHRAIHAALSTTPGDAE